MTDTMAQQRYSHLQQAEMAWEAAPCVVQYRNKSFDRKRDLPEVRAMARLAHENGRCLVINDSIDLAFELKAGGVHLGQGDGDPRLAATLLGREALVGATVHSMAELEALTGAAIHYVGIGPVFGSRSKATGLPDLGLKGLQELCAASPWPVIAIGGILDPGQATEVVAAGAHGVAILSAFCLSENPIRVARSFHQHLERA